MQHIERLLILPPSPFHTSISLPSTFLTVNPKHLRPHACNKPGSANIQPIYKYVQVHIKTASAPNRMRIM